MMSEPTTEAGKRLLDNLDAEYEARHMEPYRLSILAIEAEAVNAALDKVAAACIGLEAADLFMPHRVAAAIGAARPKP